MIYEPAEDSFLLGKAVGKRAKNLRVLDMGSGSGVLAEIALKSGAKEVLCVDIDSETVSFLKEKGLSVVQGDLFENVKGKWDLVVFNPPYLPADEREDGASARITSGGRRGDEVIVRFLRDVGDFLTEDGRVLLLVSSLTPLGEIERVIEAEGFVKEVVSQEKVFMEELVVWELRK